MPVREAIREAVRRGGARRSRAPGREAAVLVPLIERPDGLWVLFTRRTQEVPTHKGQVSFPGGAHDAADRDLETTALRETEEETGIPRSEVELVGRIDDYFTITGFRIAPFVGFVPDGIAYRPNPHECAEILEIPVSELLEEGLVAKVFALAGVRRAVLYYKARDQVVWGATAAILRDLLERIRPVVSQRPG